MLHKHKNTNETKPVIEEERTAFLSCSLHADSFFEAEYFCVLKTMSNDDSEDRYPGKCRRCQPARYQGPGKALPNRLAFYNTSIALTHESFTPPGWTGISQLFSDDRFLETEVHKGLHNGLCMWNIQADLGELIIYALKAPVHLVQSN